MLVLSYSVRFGICIVSKNNRPHISIIKNACIMKEGPVWEFFRKLLKVNSLGTEMFYIKLICLRQTLPSSKRVDSEDLIALYFCLLRILCLYRMLTLLTKLTRLFSKFFISPLTSIGIALSLIFLHFLIMLNNSATESI